MTKYEKLTLAMSAAAIVSSVVTPYCVLDQETKQYNSRGRFVVVGTNVKRFEGTRLEQLVSAELKNVGRRPAEQVQLTVVFPKDTGNPAVHFSLRGIPIASRTDDNVSFYDIGRAISPQETFGVSIAGPVGAVYLHTEYGDSLTLYQRGENLIDFKTR